MRSVRYGLLICLAALTLAPAAPPEYSAQAAPAGSEYLVYIGTYTGPKSKGIYAYRFEAVAFKLDAIGLVGEMVEPSFLALHPNHQFLYAVSELGNDGRVNGSITAFRIDRTSGALTALNTVASGGGGSCHLVVDKTGKCLIVANYGSGSVAAFVVNPDGRLRGPTSVMQHSGSSVDRRRQGGPHAHAVVLSPDNRFVFVPDLGLDQIRSFRLDPATAHLTPNDPPFVAVKPGSGPRHFAFSPGGRFAYCVHEMGSMVTAFAYEAASGKLTQLQTISTLPADFHGEDNSAEIEVDAKGRFLYASNRGHDSITVFAIEPKQGTLSVVENVATQGHTPRNFKIDPSGRYLFAANQDSNNIVIFRIDPETGRLTPTGKVLQVQSPVCVQFVPSPVKKPRGHGA
jgi:6-phosphogluconolactonase